MAAILTTTGVTFSDTTTISSKYGIFPQSSAVVFYQAAAPTGWTTEPTVHNNKALRVVSGAAANSAGTNNFTTCMASPRPFSANVPVTVNGASGGNTTLDINQIPTHSHPALAGPSISLAANGPERVANVGSTGNVGNNGAHAHPLSVNAANGPISSSFDFAVQYINVIYCVFS
jgi:hypothetical protein